MLNLLFPFFLSLACNGVYNSSHGFLISPNFPAEYHNFAKCHYLIERKDLNERITIDFIQFSLEKHLTCAHDSVKIYDGNSTSANLLGPTHGYCGPCLPPTLTSTGNSLLIVFVSNKIVTSSGFNFTYRGKSLLPLTTTGRSCLTLKSISVLLNLLALKKHRICQNTQSPKCLIPVPF